MKSKTTQLKSASTITRRRFLVNGSLATGLLGGCLVTTRMAFAAPGAANQGRFVFVILRGALDGLSAVPPYGDPAYAALRGQIAVPAPSRTLGDGKSGLKLDNTFALHPSLSFMHERWRERELVVMHAVATPYRERSHFDAQDVLESGGLRPHALATGWLNRSFGAAGGYAANTSAARALQSKELGVALGSNVPLVMRGPAQVASWSPSRLSNLSDDTLQRLADLYATDGLLSQRLADALASDSIATAGQREMREALADNNSMGVEAGEAVPAAGNGRRYNAARYVETVRAAASFLRRDDGPRVAVLETSGWDTHANEGGAEGPLAVRLATLDAGLREFRIALGPAWQNTAVLLVTEFGRTAAVNGTRGTDHGTGAAAFLVGGAVAGGRMLADWPGLAPAALYEGRDVRPTLDLRAVIKGVLHEQLGVADRALDSEVFPDSGAVRRVAGLIRG